MDKQSFLTNNEKQEHLDHLRHSAAHLLAAAVLELYPNAKRTIGPAIENGFYYDFDFGSDTITEEDIIKIEEKMGKLLKDWKGFNRREVSAEEAKEFYKDNPYKIELIEQFAGEGQTLTMYDSMNYKGEAFYTDLCRGGHSEFPKKEIGAFKLLSLAGAYWRGDEKNKLSLATDADRASAKMLTRIYGTAFPTKEELDEYLNQLEEARKRDHKRLGRELELFFFHETSPGMAYWLPKGLLLYNQLYAFARQLYDKYGYQEVSTPQLNKKELYKTSGHWDHYRDDMFISPMSYITEDSKEILEGSEVFGIKPMNCPNAMNIFAFRTRSYTELPLRLSETTSLHRFELSGTLNGLFRIRQFRQDDAHLFLRDSQVKDEFGKLMNMIADMYEPFGIQYKLRFGTRPENFMGEASDWDKAEETLEQVLKESGQEYFRVDGEGAFYGPKIDILMKDSLGREWQTGTIQLDFQQPKNFKLKYIESDGSEVIPVVFHRAIYGSFERFLGILIEHYGGAFPAWLAPQQVMVIPISDKHVEYAKEIVEAFRAENVRIDLDSRTETMQSKIRNAQLLKIPYMIVVGDKEMEAKQISVRSRNGESKNGINLEEFIVELKTEITNKK